MDMELREQFFTIINHFRRLESALMAECEMQINEMAVLYSIAGNCCQECPNINLNVPKIQEKLCISKPAVSYILNALEKKNYITREIDSRDRRKVSIGVTEEGKEVAAQSMGKYEELWSEILERFGEENMRQLMELLRELDHCTSDNTEEKKG